jgi:hypothetical protein
MSTKSGPQILFSVCREDNFCSVKYANLDSAFYSEEIEARRVLSLSRVQSLVSSHIESARESYTPTFNGMSASRRDNCAETNEIVF